MPRHRTIPTALTVIAAARGRMRIVCEKALMWFLLGEQRWRALRLSSVPTAQQSLLGIPARQVGQGRRPHLRATAAASASTSRSGLPGWSSPTYSSTRCETAQVVDVGFSLLRELIVLRREARIRSRSVGRGIESSASTRATAAASSKAARRSEWRVLR